MTYQASIVIDFASLGAGLLRSAAAGATWLTGRISADPVVVLDLVLLLGAAPPSGVASDAVRFLGAILCCGFRWTLCYTAGLLNG